MSSPQILYTLLGLLKNKSSRHWPNLSQPDRSVSNKGRLGNWNPFLLSDQNQVKNWKLFIKILTNLTQLHCYISNPKSRAEVTAWSVSSSHWLPSQHCRCQLGSAPPGVWVRSEVRGWPFSNQSGWCPPLYTINILAFSKRSISHVTWKQ